MNASICASTEWHDALGCERERRGQLLTARFSQNFSLQDNVTSEREALAQFIRDCFAKAHGARIEHFMPRLLSLRNRQGTLIAAFGLRTASSGPLFLEHYLDAPVEELLAARSGRPVERRDVIEVGNLSATDAGAIRFLMVAVTMLLHRAGYRWIVFTGTNVVRNGLHRIGLRPQVLAEARLERLPEGERAHWGNYYAHAPTVMCGEISRGYDALLADDRLLAVLDARAQRGVA